jgi:hypothetical protein
MDFGEAGLPQSCSNKRSDRASELEGEESRRGARAGLALEQLPVDRYPLFDLRMPQALSLCFQAI